MSEERRPYLAAAFWLSCFIGIGVWGGQHEKHKREMQMHDSLPESAKPYDINRDGLDKTELRNYLRDYKFNEKKEWEQDGDLIEAGRRI